MSNALRSDTISWIATFILKKNDGTDYAAFNLAETFGTHASLGLCFPALASPPIIKSGAGISALVRYDNTIVCYLNGSIDYAGTTLASVLSQVEPKNGTVVITSCAGTANFSGTDAQRIFEVKDWRIDGATDTVVFALRDRWFKDIEMSRTFDDMYFPNVEENWKGAVGALAFGRDVVIDAPFISSGVDGSSQPVAELFSGFPVGGFFNKEFKKLWVANPTSQIDSMSYAEVDLVADPQDDDGSMELGSSRNLKNESWATVLPNETKARIMPSIRVKVSANQWATAPYLGEGKYLTDNARGDLLSVGDENFTIAFWARFTSGYLSSGSGRRTIVMQGRPSRNKREWSIHFESGASNKVGFGISNSGTAYDREVYCSSGLSANTWYYIVAYHNAVSNSIGISINSSAASTATTGTDTPNQTNNRFSIGAADGAPGFDGHIGTFAYWNRVLSAGEITTMYNSGVPRYSDNIPDAQQDELRCFFDLDEPAGSKTWANSFGSTDLILGYRSSSTTTYPLTPVVMTSANGELTIAIYHATQKDGTGTTYQIDGGALHSYTFNTAEINDLSDEYLYAQFNPPFVKLPGHSYMATLEWSNRKSNRYYFTAVMESNAGHHYHKKDWLADNPGWEEASTMGIVFSPFYLGQGAAGWSHSLITGSSLALEGKSITTHGGQVQEQFNSGLTFKIQIDGIADSSGGLVTGTPYQLLDNPADIVYFLLRMVGGVAASSIGDFSTARGKLATEGFAHSFAIEGPTKLDALIVDVCRWSRTLLNCAYSYSAPNHLQVFSLYYQRPAAEPTAAEKRKLSKSYRQGDMKLLDYLPMDVSMSLNDFKQSHTRDVLNVPKDPAFIRRAQTDKFTGLQYCNGSDSSDGDAYRQGLCAASEALYGKREVREPLYMTDSAAEARAIQNYYLDRYWRIPMRAHLRVKGILSAWSLFQDAETADIALPVLGGASEEVGCYYLNSPVKFTYENVQVPITILGTVRGVVVETVSQGETTDVTIETTNLFNAV